MKLYKEISLADFEAWSGAVDTPDRIRSEGKCADLEAILEDLYPDGMDETSLNDLLWFEPETVFEWLGITGEDEDEEEPDEEEIRERLEEAAQADNFLSFCACFPDCKGCPCEDCANTDECLKKWNDEWAKPC